jgi:hypothetical protein
MTRNSHFDNAGRGTLRTKHPLPNLGVNQIVLKVIQNALDLSEMIMLSIQKVTISGCLPCLAYCYQLIFQKIMKLYKNKILAAFTVLIQYPQHQLDLFA